MRGKKEERNAKEEKKCRKEYADDLFAYIVTVMTPSADLERLSACQQHISIGKVASSS